MEKVFKFASAVERILQSKLTRYRLDKQTARWVETWMNDWIQRVAISDTKAGQGPVSSIAP